MRKRYVFGAGLVLLALLLTLVVWQVSFNFGEFGPTNAAQTFAFWALSTLIFLLTVTLGFMLFRTAVRLYLERQRNHEGSRIKSKLVLGALALAGVCVVGLLLAYEHSLISHNDLGRLNAAFFTMNGVISLVFFLFIAADILRRKAG